MDTFKAMMQDMTDAQVAKGYSDKVVTLRREPRNVANHTTALATALAVAQK